MLIYGLLFWQVMESPVIGQTYTEKMGGLKSTMDTPLPDPKRYWDVMIRYGIMSR